MGLSCCKWPLDCFEMEIFPSAFNGAQPPSVLQQSLLTLEHLSCSALQTAPASRWQPWTRSSKPQRWSSGCSPCGRRCSSPNTTTTPTSSSTAQSLTANRSKHCSSCQWVSKFSRGVWGTSPFLRGRPSMHSHACQDFTSEISSGLLFFAVCQQKILWLLSVTPILHMDFGHDYKLLWVTFHMCGFFFVVEHIYVYIRDATINR